MTARCRQVFRGAAFCFLAAGVLGLSGCVSVRPPLTRSLPKNAVPQVVAVTAFDNRAGFEGQWNIGSGMADLVVSELIQSKNFIVVERGHLDTVVGELNLQKDKRFRPEGKVEDGRLKNARYLVRGVITDFSQTGGSSIAIAIRSLFLGGKGYQARVALVLTIVDVESGEVVDSVQCSGTARAGESYAAVAYKGVSFGGDSFFKTPLGEATALAIRRGVNGIIKKMPVVQWEPMIADVSADGKIILNGGTEKGFRVGAAYDVRGEGKPVTDPATGDLLQIVPGPVLGVLRVTVAEKKISYAEAVKGSGFKRGQRLVRSPAAAGK